VNWLIVPRSMNARGENLEDAIEHADAVLGVEALGESHGIDQVGKSTLTCLRSPSRAAAGGEDLFGDVPRGVSGAHRAPSRARRRPARATHRRNRKTSGPAGSGPRSAGRRCCSRSEARTPTEARAVACLVPAVRAPHSWSSAVKIARPPPAVSVRTGSTRLRRRGGPARSDSPAAARRSRRSGPDAAHPAPPARRPDQSSIGSKWRPSPVERRAAPRRARSLRSSAIENPVAIRAILGSLAVSAALLHRPPSPTTLEPAALATQV